MHCGGEAIAHEMTMCCCGSPHQVRRRALTKKEKTEHLKEYKEQLELEITGVEEKIEELEKGK